MKEYKENPDNFKGNVADVSTVIRVALTGKNMTPVSGKAAATRRMKKFPRVILR